MKDKFYRAIDHITHLAQEDAPYINAFDLLRLYSVQLDAIYYTAMEVLPVHDALEIYDAIEVAKKDFGVTVLGRV